jgi:ribonuclease HII
MQYADDTFEQELRAAGRPKLVGLDEVGRGAWAGPVCVGAVWTDTNGRLPDLLADSKLLSKHRRRELAEELALRVAGRQIKAAVGEASPQEIDSWGMTGALRVAARRAIARLGDVAIDAVILDGPHDYLTGMVPLDAWEYGDIASDLDVRCVVGGDLTCSLVSAASIVAKVHRDCVLAALDDGPDGYGMANHAGYATLAHQEAVARLGLSPWHRTSWNVKNMNKTSGEVPT